jgi:hypothetical protein
VGLLGSKGAKIENFWTVAEQAFQAYAPIRQMFAFHVPAFRTQGRASFSMNCKFDVLA